VSYGFEKLALSLCCRGSYGFAVSILNAALHRQGDASISTRTLIDHVHSMGRCALDAQEGMAMGALEACGISWDSALPASKGSLPGNVILPEEGVGQASPAVMRLMADL